MNQTGAILTLALEVALEGESLFCPSVPIQFDKITEDIREKGYILQKSSIRGDGVGAD